MTFKKSYNVIKFLLKFFFDNILIFFDFKALKQNELNNKLAELLSKIWLQPKTLDILNIFRLILFLLEIK